MVVLFFTRHPPHSLLLTSFLNLIFLSLLLCPWSGDFTLMSKKHVKRDEIEDKVSDPRSLVVSSLLFFCPLFCWAWLNPFWGGSSFVRAQVVWITGASRGIGMVSPLASSVSSCLLRLARPLRYCCWVVPPVFIYLIEYSSLRAGFLKGRFSRSS